MSYDELLERAIKKIPKKVDSSERFVIPKFESEISGARTIITNFGDVASILRRQSEHLQKFILKELATKGNLEGKRLVVLGNFSRNVLEKKLENYVKEYVICPE